MDPVADANSLPVLVGRIDGKMDILLTRSDGFDARLRKVEQRLWWMTGAGAAVAYVVTKYTTLFIHP